MGDIVEHVGKAVEHSLLKGDGGNGYAQPDGIEPFTLVVDCEVDPKAVARAAIRATLEFLRENVSEGMAEAFQDAAFEYREGSFITCQQGVSRVVSAALNDIERTG